MMPPDDLSDAPSSALSMLHRVVLQPEGSTFPAPESQTVLQSADAAGVALPSLCRNGVCRTCLCRLHAGRVRYVVEWPGLSADEKAEGWILPCVAVPESDLVMEATPLWWDETSGDGAS